MDVIESISTKRSIRTYTDEKISEEVIQHLLTLGTKASTGSNQQPWGFVVIQNKDEINELSEKIKAHLLANMARFPYLAQYENWLLNPKYSVFNHAANLIIIYGCTDSHYYLYDCTLAAANIMLAAYSMNIGTCWIGFAEYMLNTKEFKKQYHVPENYELVCPLSLGRMKGTRKPPTRNAPVIFNR